MAPRAEKKPAEKKPAAEKPVEEKSKSLRSVLLLLHPEK
jgi:hypothetical protein